MRMSEFSLSRAALELEPRLALSGLAAYSAMSYSIVAEAHDADDDRDDDDSLPPDPGPDYPIYPPGSPEPSPGPFPGYPPPPVFPPPPIGGPIGPA